MKNTLTDYLSRIITKLIPIRQTQVMDQRHEPLSFLASLDADTMAGILAEAEDGYTERLFTLYRDLMVDTHLQGEFNKRKLAVLKEIPSFTPDDPDDPTAVLACDEIKSAWKQLKGKREALTHLLDSTLYPVALVEKIWRVQDGGYRLDRLVPVPHHLLDYRDGCLKVRRIGADGRPVDLWQKPDASRYIIHRGHLLTSFPDKWGGPMRAVLFWWLFKTMNREWWARFLDRFGSPFLVGKYNTSDDRSRAELAHAFSQATRIFGLTIPEDASVEMVQAASAQTGDAFEKFHSVANAEISKLIVGQTMTTEAAAGGIGGTQANVHQGVRDDIQGFDSVALGETLRDQLFDQHLIINGIAGGRPEITFGGQGEADAKATAEYMAALSEAGFEPADDAAEFLSRVGGFNVRRRSDQPPAGDQPLPDNEKGDAAPTENVQSKALNGAQIRSLLEVIESVRSGSLPKDTAAGIIGAAFPFDEQTISDLLSQITASESIALSAEEPTLQLASNAAAAVSRELRQRSAGLPEVIASASSPADLEDRLIQHFSRGHSAAASAIADVLTTHALNGLEAPQ